MPILKYDSSGNLVDAFDDPSWEILKMAAENETLKARVEELEREREGLVALVKGKIFNLGIQLQDRPVAAALSAYRKILAKLKWEVKP